jgi:hypothetical protein
MKRQIRNNVFETNSSSVHSMTICMKEDFDKWCKGETLRSDYGDFIPAEEARLKNAEKLKKYSDATDEQINQYLAGDLNLYDILGPWDEIAYYHDPDAEDRANETLKYFEETFTTPKGDTVVAFGYYGTDY